MCWGPLTSLLRKNKSMFWSRNPPLTSPPLASVFSDLVGVGERRAGEETETEEQAGAGHRHNGPHQLRTIQQLHLIFSFTPPLHLSLPLRSSHPDYKQNSNPPTIRQTNCKKTEAVNCKTGVGGFSRDGRACVRLHVYVCVCVQPRSVCEPVSVRDWDTELGHTWTRGET